MLENLGRITNTNLSYLLQSLNKSSMVSGCSIIPFSWLNNWNAGTQKAWKKFSGNQGWRRLDEHDHKTILKMFTILSFLSEGKEVHETTYCCDKKLTTRQSTVLRATT